MADRNDGGYAFPHPGSTNEYGNATVYPELGMTLRDYFATHAPQHRVDFDSPQQMLDFLGRKNVSPGGMEGKAHDAAAVQAKLNYIYADAMLAERAKGGAS